jgi:hypothetical protein
MRESPLTYCAATAPMFNFEHPRNEIRASVAALVVQLTIVTRCGRARSVCRFCVTSRKPVTPEDSFIFQSK